jgi:hypothetical protein
MIEQAVREITAEIIKERSGSVALKSPIDWEIFVENIIIELPIVEGDDYDDNGCHECDDR